MYAKYLHERSDQVKPAVVLLVCAIGLCFYFSPMLFAMADRMAA